MDLQNVKNVLIPYKKWKISSRAHHYSFLNFATGVGGILYPPRCLDEEVLNEKAFMTLCPSADDIWFKAMALKKGTKCSTLNVHNPVYIENSKLQSIALYNVNVHKDKNDEQLKKVFDRYNLYHLLK